MLPVEELSSVMILANIGLLPMGPMNPYRAELSNDLRAIYNVGQRRM